LRVDQDNGAKLIDPRGEMLDPSWEVYASTVANAETASDLVQAIADLVSAQKIDLSKPSSVICGRDTRPSGNELNEALQLGVQAMGGEHAELVDLGIVTTPCVHYAVKARNLDGDERKAYGEPTLDGYLSKMAIAFNQLMVSTFGQILQKMDIEVALEIK
jgi:phosphoacetylglucosamine mutase